MAIAVVLTVVLPAPPIVSASPEPVTPPVSVNVPASELIRAAEPNVIAPDQVLLFARLRNAPPELMPSLLSVIGSAMVSPLPSTCTAAPLVTEVPLVGPPRPLLFCTSTMPMLTVVKPVYVLVPESVSMPEPSLVRVVPLPEITPLTVVLPLPPTVRPYVEPAILPLTVSVPASELMRDAEPSVIAPDQVFAFARLRSTPSLLMPVPRSVIGSAMARPLPSTCTAAPR